jgi:ABC-type transport system involved in multi-copper enzyme maturation permease subunit
LIAAVLGTATWFLGGIGAIFGFYWIILGLIIILGAVLMYSNPSSTHTWSIVILVLLIISGLNIFALIGGILGSVWKGGKQGAPPPLAPP